MGMNAKIRLSQKIDEPASEHQGAFSELHFYADYADGKNKEWATSTPTLNLVMRVKKEIADTLEAGKSYDLVFQESTTE